MKKTFVIVLIVLMGLYVVLHLILGSSPVQRRVVDEIQAALSQLGMRLKIESIEFSAFSPKIYLNRVTVSGDSNSVIPLEIPFTIDKIKVEFQPIALLSKRLIIDEAVLYTPKILLPRADRAYKKIKALLSSEKAMEVEGGDFTVQLKRIGAVDAFLNVISQNPELALRSRSVTVFFDNSDETEKIITLNSKDLEFDRAKLKLTFNHADVHVVAGANSLLIERAVLSGKDYSVNTHGTVALPLTSSSNQLPNLDLVYDVRVPMGLLNTVRELDFLPDFEGTLVSSGKVSKNKTEYGGAGEVRYEQFEVDGYKIGGGDFTYKLNKRKVRVTNVSLRYAGGEVISNRLDFNLSEKFDFEGPILIRGVHLQDLLVSLKTEEIPIDMQFGGRVDVTGQFSSPFLIEGKVNAAFSTFNLWDDFSEPPTDENNILPLGQGEAKGTITFHSDRFEYQTIVNLLDGMAESSGYLTYDTVAKIKIRGEKLSLTKLEKIANVKFGGIADVVTEVDVVGSDAKVSGSFEVQDAEIADIVLGNMRGLAHFENALLSFEDLQMPTKLDQVSGTGFLDFRNDVRYKFRAQSRRVSVDRVFSIFQKTELNFSQPTGGEAAARVTIRGGHDDKGIEVSATGEAKDFRWYGERWSSSSFDVNYREQGIRVNNIRLMKKSGALELKGRFTGQDSYLSFLSRGLRLEELDLIGQAPASGEIVGEIKLEGDLSYPMASGNLSLIRSAYRGLDVPDSRIQLISQEKSFEIVANLMGERFKGRWKRVDAKKRSWEVAIFFDGFDFAPLITVLLGKDLPMVTDARASGDLAVTGRWGDWSSLEGSGAVSNLRLGLKGTPMRNTRPIMLTVERGKLKIPKFNLVGRESQLSFALDLRPEEQLMASLDGKLDLQFLQPFIPGLEYGRGKVALGLRASGNPNDYNLLGNIVLSDGDIRLTGLLDEFKSTEIRLSLSQDRINVDRFETLVNGGTLKVDGDVLIDRLNSFEPNLRLNANRIGLRIRDYLVTQLTGEFYISGKEAPYLLGGKCRILRGDLTKLDLSGTADTIATGEPIFRFDIRCSAKEKLFVNAEVMQAEFRGNFHVLGNSEQVGLKGTAEALRGFILFREKKFELQSATVKFESERAIKPSYNISGRTEVTEISAQDTQIPQTYEVNMLVLGTPDKATPSINLTSSPALARNEIISLLMLGVTTQSQTGSYVEFGTALAGQIPITKKLESKLGVDIRITQGPGTTGFSGNVQDPDVATSDITAPTVVVGKKITDNLELSLSNTLETLPKQEVELKYSLTESLTVNGSVGRKSGGTSSTQSSNDTVEAYGLDFRYRFYFE